MTAIAIKKAAICIHNGGVVAYPTEAVWGLGCDPYNEAACLDLLQIKKRPVEKGMILVAGAIEQLSALLAPLSPQQQQQLAHAWQNQDKTGPVTFLVEDSQQCVPEWVRGTHSAVAVRVSMHPLVRALCLAVGGPVVSTSANHAGRPPARSRVQVEKHLGRDVDFVLPGALGGARKPSQIIDLASGRVLRAA